MDGVELDGVEPVRGCLSIVVLGASGDLAKKMTFPALFNLYQQVPAYTVQFGWLFIQGFLHSDEVRIFGYARTRNLDDEFRYRLHRFLDHDKVVSPAQTEDVSEFLHLVKYISGSYDAEEDFRSLDKEINEHKSSKVQQDGSSRRLFYLALPPSVYPSAYKMIKLFCMNKSKYGGWTRIVIEKPFGKGFGLLEKLSNQIGELLHEKQLYRIDNYLGKELVQNLMVLRFANRFFLPLWNRDNFDNIQIVFQEDFGTEGRAGYFDEFGVIRDIIQNHLLQVLCQVAMEKPVSVDPEHIRDTEVRVLQSVCPIQSEEVVLGQYEGYCEDPTVPDDSNTPTFATIILRTHYEKWDRKALNSRKSEIRIQFKDVPGDIFESKKHGRNELAIRLQPSEAIYMKLTIGVKQPGLEMDTTQSELDLSYKQCYQGITIPEAYECLILDTYDSGHQQHFVRRDELTEAWKFFTPLLPRIENGEIKPILYKRGTTGLLEADDLVQKAGYVQTQDYVWIEQ
ncbi:Glucose-6-phosphate dehydrogenase, C-terminal [Dillenia turbinata]|uniref:Glucose-6-phosphate 1-dehydrogenase n=1 Tax=Dillenia turbinata TaxID=194707 RepID=A0AAN8Z8S5_9MAGN